MRTLNRACRRATPRRRDRRMARWKCESARGKNDGKGKRGGYVREEATPRIRRCCLSFALERASPSPPLCALARCRLFAPRVSPLPFLPLNAASPPHPGALFVPRARSRNIGRAQAWRAFDAMMCVPLGLIYTRDLYAPTYDGSSRTKGESSFKPGSVIIPFPRSHGG